MELLLRDGVPHLGKAGEVVRVKDGYARNFLFPKGLAMPVSKENLRVVGKEAARREAEQRKQVEDLKALAAKLQDATCTIAEKVAEGGHLYGSVTALKVAEGLKAMGFPIEEKHVRLEHPIKEIGTFPVQIHLHAEVEATAHVVVVEEKG